MSSSARQFAAADMNDVFHAVVEFTQPHLSEGTVVTIKMRDNLPKVRSNPHRFVDVLYHAIRQTPVLHLETMIIDGEVHLCLPPDLSNNFCIALTTCAEIISDHGGHMYSWRPHSGGASCTILLPAL